MAAIYCFFMIEKNHFSRKALFLKYYSIDFTDKFGTRKNRYSKQGQTNAGANAQQSSGKLLLHYFS